MAATATRTACCAGCAALLARVEALEAAQAMSLQHLRDERERACWNWLAKNIGSDTFQSADVEERGDMYPDFGRLLQAADLRHPAKEDSVKAIGYALRHARGKQFGGKTLMRHDRDAEGAVWQFTTF